MMRAMPTTVVDHPLAAERLTALRDERTPRPDFRRALSELSWLLVYEATRDLGVKTFQVQTPLAPATGTRVDPVPLIVPVLRAGLGMLDAAFTMLPSAEVCSTTTTLAASVVGSRSKIAVSACSPPADAPMTTRSRCDMS